MNRVWIFTMKITYMNLHNNHAKMLASCFNAYGCKLYGLCNSFLFWVCENNIQALKVVLNESPHFQEKIWWPIKAYINVSIQRSFRLHQQNYAMVDVFLNLEQFHESIFRGLRLPYNHRHMIFVLWASSHKLAHVLHRLSQSTHVVFIPKTHIIWSSLKIIEGWTFY